jgi:hypothetical protein
MNDAEHEYAANHAYRSAFRHELVQRISKSQRTAPRSRAKLLAATGVGVCVLGGGATAAYSAISQAHVTDHAVARCYSSDVYVSGDDFPGTTIAEPDSKDGHGSVTSALEGCAAVWRAGILRIGANGATAAPVESNNFPVPHLFACVMPNGQAAVFPGTQETCATLGLPDSQ